MKLEVSVPEVVELFKEIQEQPEKVFEMIRVDMRETVGQYLTQLMRAELTAFLGRQPYERNENEANHRNGTYGRNFALKGIGQVSVDVPRDRKGAFQTCVIPRSKQYENAIRQDLSMMFLTGVSTRSLSLMSKRLIGRSISPAQVSNANKELTDAVETWRTRDLATEAVKYMFVDGVNFSMRVDRSVEVVPVLVCHRRCEIGPQAGSGSPGRR